MTTPRSPTPRYTTTRPPGPRSVVLRPAVAWFATRGVTLERVLSDDGSAHKSHLGRDACVDGLGMGEETRPYRPQTSGKIQPFHRTLADGWGYARHYTSETERRDGAARLALSLQPAQAPLSLREQATPNQLDQRPRSVHLVTREATIARMASVISVIRVLPAALGSLGVAQALAWCARGATQGPRPSPLGRRS